MKEREIIALVAGMAGDQHPDLLVGIGDDCAVLRKDRNRSWLVTMDTLVEGVHFDLRWHPAELLGRKSVSVNVSDIAAMGGQPVFAFLSLGLPAGFDSAWLTSFSRGLHGACGAYGCLLAGGDTILSPSAISITLTLIGEVEAGHAVLRRGAHSGDILWVSGTLGRAAAGLELCRQGRVDEPKVQDLVAAHLDPQPRLELGRRLAAAGLAHAMMDLSDGLATDLAHLCLQSGAGVRIDAARLPASPSLRVAAGLLGRDPLAWMVSGGEDYELAFAAAPEDTGAVLVLAGECGVAVTAIGAFDALPGVRLLRSEPDRIAPAEEDISFKGYDHFS